MDSASPTKPGITVLTLVPNAGDRLARCLESVHWTDHQFCVVDPRTSDGSAEVAQRLADRVITHEYRNAADQRNWAIPQIDTEWTLVLDADEWVSAALKDRIQKIMADPGSADGFRIKRESWFMGRLMKHCGWERDYNIRLFRTRKGRYLEKKVHSKVLVEGRMGQIDEPMYHDTYRNFEEYFNTFHRFTRWGAEDLFERGKRPRYTDLTLRPMVKFLKMYFLRLGFLDGRHGAILCMLGAFSVYMKYAHLWRLWREADGLPLAPPADAPGERRP